QPGAPPGEYRVLVFVHEQTEDAGAVHPSLPQSLIDPIYQDAERTPLRVNVVAEPSPQAYDLEVHHGPSSPRR
ncbi:MAG: hypothetical protein KDA75_20380, partial [Planctomycetaceae bacterium]|nr:hypothetical protein [Planctomycetaceae bacterium]